MFIAYLVANLLKDAHQAIQGILTGWLKKPAFINRSMPCMYIETMLVTVYTASLSDNWEKGDERLKFW